MGVVAQIKDRLSNVMSGMGTTADRRAWQQYSFMPVAPEQAEAAYRSSWLMRKIIDIPPLDMTRGWRAWQAGKNDIEKLEAEERRLKLREKCKRALVLARLWGGGALILGTADANPASELNPEILGLGGLKYVHVVGRHQLGVAAVIQDPASPWFGQPDKYTLSNGSTQIDLHPSRVIPFVGQPGPEGGRYDGISLFWGDPLMQSIEGAVKNADLAQDGFAALIDEAKIDILKIPDMMANVGTKEYEDRLLARLGAAAMGKSTWRALMIDGAEEWEQRQITWAGMPDIIASYLQIVAGAADIPITRLLGQSPKGLQSSGDGEERDYHAMIAARQDELLAPALDRIDELLVRSALGTVPSDVWYKFNPLSQITPKDAADIESKRASTVKTYADTGLFPEDALAALAKNAVIESGQWPGSEAAFEEAELPAPFEEDGPDEGDLMTEEERAAAVPVPGAKPEKSPVKPVA
jgi:phage-related protein (TIGR01555 family)